MVHCGNLLGGKSQARKSKTQLTNTGIVLISYVCTMHWEVWVEKGESHLNTIHGQGIVYCPPLSSWLACVRISNLKSSPSSSSTKNGDYSWSVATSWDTWRIYSNIFFRRLYFQTLCVLKCFLANDSIDSMHIHHSCTCKVFRLCDFFKSLHKVAAWDVW